jgi:phage anti-repressor protein
MKVLVRELYRVVKWNNSLTIWVNKRRLNLKFKSLLDYMVEGDYNKFAFALLVQDV